MHCLGCSYELRGLKVRACPECGRGFDPSDESTFDARVGLEKHTRWLEWGLIGLGTSTLLANAMVHVMLVAARLSLGRWPHRAGADDPKGVDGIGVLYVLPAVVLEAALWAVVPAATLAIGLAAHRAWARLRRGLTVALALWLGGCALFWWDPAEAWYWYFD